MTGTPTPGPVKPSLEPADLRVVLVAPEGEANMGAVARSMACFGVGHLVLVNPYRTPGQVARDWSCHGESILERCATARSLDEALQGVTLAVGMTRRAGKRRHRMVTPEEFRTAVLPGFLPGRVALVFGPEESGLANEDLDRCHRLVQIPTHPRHGSLNLSHAVTVMLYELFGRESTPAARAAARSAADPASPAMRRSMLDALAGHLHAMGYPFHPASLEEEMTKLGDILERAALEEWETRFLLGMFKHLRVRFTRLQEVAGERQPALPE